MKLYCSNFLQVSNATTGKFCFGSGSVTCEDYTNRGFSFVNNKLDIQAKSFCNDSLFLVNGNSVITTESANNVGFIGGEGVRVESNSFSMGQEGIFNCRSGAISCKEDFGTDGTFTCKVLKIESPNSSFQKGNVCSERLHVKSKAIYNDSTWRSNTVNVAMESLENHGAIKSQEMNVEGNSMKNSNSIHSDHIKLNCKSLEETESGILMAKEMELSCGNVTNEGSITADNLVGMGEDLKNVGSGSIKGNKVDWTTAGGIQNESRMHGNERLTLKGKEVSNSTPRKAYLNEHSRFFHINAEQSRTY